MSVSHEIRLGPDGPRFLAPADRTLLQSAHAAGLAWPSACRNGTCRHCIRYLTQGEVSYHIEWPGLLREEKAAGAILPCVAYPACSLLLVPEEAADGPGDASDGQSLPVG